MKMKIFVFDGKTKIEHLGFEIPKFDEFDDLKVFIGEKLSINAEIKDSYQLVYENIILNDCNKLIKYIEMCDYEQIWIGHLEDILGEDDVIVELFVCEPISSLVHLIFKKRDKICALKTELNKFGLSIDYILNFKGEIIKIDQFIIDNNDDGYIKLIVKNNRTFDEYLINHNQYLIEYYLRNNDLTYLWYRDEFNLTQTNSLRQILYQMKLKLLSIGDNNSLLSKDLSIIPLSFMNSRFLYCEIMTNRICEYFIGYYWKSLIEKFGCDEIVINVFCQYFRDAVRVEIIEYTKSIRYNSNNLDKTMRRIASDALDYCLNYLIYPMKDWRYLMGLFIGEFSIGFVNDLFVDEIIDKWKESHSSIEFNWESELSGIIDKKQFLSFIDSIKSGSDGEIENKFNIKYLEMTDEDLWTPLHHACHYGRTGLVKIQMANKCDINPSNKNGSQPIHLACENGYIDIVKILIDNKCDINSSDHNGSQPIHLACESGHIDIVKILIDNKCDINGPDKLRGYQPIHLACKKDHIGIVKILIDNECDINASDKFWGYQPIHLACKKGHIGIVKILIDNNCVINAPDKIRGYQPIHWACQNGHIDIVKILIDSKCDINASDEKENQPIHLAIESGHIDIVKILIDNKCDINASDELENQSIHLAFKNGHIDIVKILIDNKCDINAPDENGYQPIHWACKNDHIDIVKILIDNKCDINSSGYWGYQPIHLARMNGHVDIMKILIDNKCDEKVLTQKECLYSISPGRKYIKNSIF